MKKLAMALFALTLFGCGRSEALDIADVNARNALANSLSSRIEELEARVEELEARLGE